MNRDGFVQAIRDWVAEREREDAASFSCDERQYVAAVFIIRTALGDDWLSRRYSFEKDPFLRNRCGAHGQFKTQDRITTLGELLLNLRRVDGFRERAELLQTESIETSIAEMEGARLLVGSRLPFRFVPPGGLLGADYDGEALIDGLTVACEMKAKLEITQPAFGSVRDTINRARRQLPQDRAGLVFLKVPESWSTAAGKDALRRGTEAAFRRSGRIAAVVVHWEKWASIGEGAFRVECFEFFENKWARCPLKTLKQAIKAWPMTKGAWRSIKKVVCSPEDNDRHFATEVAMSGIAIATGKVRLPGFGVSYIGSREHVRAAVGNGLLTVVDFRSADFDLMQPSARGVTVTLGSGPARTFTVVRDSADPQKYQVEFKESPMNAELTDVVGDVIAKSERVEKNSKTADSLEFEKEMSSDSLVRFLGSVFGQLRAEGDIRSECVLEDVVVSFFESGAEQPGFQVRYLGSRMRF